MPTKYTKEILQEAVSQSYSFAGVLRALGIRQAGGSQSHISRMVREYGIDYSHFTGQAWNKGKTSCNRKNNDAYLVRLPEGAMRPKTKPLRRAMIESGILYLCGIKGCPDPEPMWKENALTLEIDHIDGDWLNNTLENLRFACPNCHSQEPTNRSWKHRKSTN